MANVSHELKTSVGAISLLAETWSARPTRRIERLSAAREAKRVEDIIDDLLELTRLEEGDSDAEDVSLGELVTRSVDKVQTFASGMRCRSQRSDFPMRPWCVSIAAP